MDNRIIMLVMALTTFLAYPFLSGDGRKQVAPLAAQMDETEDEEEIDDDEPVSMDDDEDEWESDPQLKKENEKNNSTATDPQMSDNY